MLPNLSNYQWKKGYTYFFFSQRVAMIRNLYDIYSIGPKQLAGKQIAYAEQKTFRLKEEIVFYTDAKKTDIFFSFKARNIFDFSSVIDVFDSKHKKVGMFSKDVGSSLLRSTWHIKDPETNEKNLLLFQEKSPVLALLRRLLEFLPVFDILNDFIRTTFTVHKDGQEVGSFTRGFGIKDTYIMEIRSDVLEEVGLATILAQGVALDTLQNR